MKPIHYELYAQRLANELAPLSVSITDVLDFHEEFSHYYNMSDKELPHEIGRQMLRTPQRIAIWKALTEWDETTHTTGKDLKYSDAHTVFQFVREKKKVFCVNPGLVQALATTELSGTYDFIKLPYDAAYFAIEEPVCNINIDTTDPVLGPLKVSEPVLGFYVWHDVVVPDKGTDLRAVGILAVTAPTTELRTAGHRWFLRFTELEPLMGQPITREGLTQLVRPTNMNDDKFVILKLALNTLLYLNSAQPNISQPHSHGVPFSKRAKKIKNPKKLRQLQARAGPPQSSMEHWDLGRDILVNKDMPSTRVDGVGGWHYTYQFTVRGHFRNQACGKNRGDHKLIWIQPFYKGPDKAETIHRRYTLK